MNAASDGLGIETSLRRSRRRFDALVTITSASNPPHVLPSVDREDPSDDDCQRASASAHLRCPKRLAHQDAVCLEGSHEEALAAGFVAHSERL